MAVKERMAAGSWLIILLLCGFICDRALAGYGLTVPLNRLCSNTQAHTASYTERMQHRLLLSICSWKKTDFDLQCCATDVQTDGCRKDYYDVLQVSRGADESQIKRAYRKLALKFHPVSTTNPLGTLCNCRSCRKQETLPEL